MSRGATGAGRIARRAAFACALAAAIPLAACGGGGNGTTAASGTSTASSPPPQVVVQSSGSQFNPVEIYKKAAPGVVTVLSVFGSGGGLLGEAAAGQGSGFVLN